MPKRLAEGALSVPAVRRLLTDANVSSRGLSGKNALLWTAHDKRLITKEQLDASLEARNSIIPCYLRTHITTPAVYDKLEEYVKAWSRLFSRGTYLANLVALSQPVDLPDGLHRRTLPVAHDCPIYAFISDVDHLKQLFAPELWPTSKGQVLHSLVEGACEQHRAALAAMAPRDTWAPLMSTRGWYQALNRMGSKYLANIKVHVQCHLIRRLGGYARVMPLEAEESRPAVKILLFGQLRPVIAHDADFAWCVQLRERMQCAADQWFSSVQVRFSPDSWCLHAWLGRTLPTEGKRFSLLPVSSLSRQYAYVDVRIAEALLKGVLAKSGDLQTMLSLDSESFNRRRSQLRKMLRARYRHRPPGDRQRLLKRKWQNLGHSCLPKAANVRSFETDGVGLRLVLELPGERPVPLSSDPCSSGPTWQSDERADSNEPVSKAVAAEDVYAIGIDTGRAKLMTSAATDGEVRVLTRSAYYFKQRQSWTRRWEKGRAAQPHIRAALNALSDSGGFKNADADTWSVSFATVVSHWNTLYEEYVETAERAQHKMLCFRWKRSCVDRFIADMLRPAPEGATIHVGLGDGCFSSTGRGEQAVPTTAIGRAFKRVRKCRDMSFVMHSIDEFKTTICCYRCGSETTALRVAGHRISTCACVAGAPSGNCALRASRRFRLCAECAEPNGMVRNRDVNAAKNILQLLLHELQGLPRPIQMRRPVRPAPAGRRTAALLAT